MSPTRSGGKAFLTGIPRRTDAGSVAPPNWLYSALDASNANGDWWDDDFRGAETSIASVEEAIVEQGIAGLVGHEMGGTLAAIVAARSALGEGPPLKFAVVCSAAMPATGPYADLLARLQESPEASVPTLHCIGSDGVEDAEQLAACFAPSAEILRHERGRAMPDETWWEQTRGYPERVTGGRFWCTQHHGPWTY